MSNFFELTGPEVPASDGKVERLVIVLHGYGADGNDLIGLAGVWAPILPHTQFIAPNAPSPCDQNPHGFQWFPIGRLDPEAMLKGARTAAPLLDAFIDAQLAKHKLNESKLALVGFSQGTIMALHVGLRRTTQLAGIVGYSGALAGVEALQKEIKTHPPVLLIHGDADPVVPVQALKLASDGLKQAGVTVETHISPGIGHGIDQDGVELGGRFLKRVLG
jgi:phospholipase/carboxylesterase